MSNPLHGIVHGDANGNLSHLPLEEVTVNVFLLDVSARVTLRQRFSNPSELATGRAKYVFPVPARAAVCAFEMRFADGRVITGVAKENQQASQEYETAVRQGKASALVDWVTDGLFTISLGSIPARQTITAKLVFVMDLMDDELKDQVRLLLPMFMGCRYGIQPTALDDATSVASEKTRLHITVDIQMSGAIRIISSPTHPDIRLESYVTSTGKISQCHKTAKFRSLSFLTASFVLVVQADGLDAPRCFAERDTGDSGFVALQLTMVSKFKLPPIPAQEYIFLVDRSFSMIGASMETSKNALSFLLPMLPNAKTSFNIFSFGGWCDSLWLKNRNYTEDTLRSANSHIQSMEADYGGTELESALASVFIKRNMLIPTLVFVLTDGRIYNVDAVLHTVRKAVSLATPDAPLRVFSLGIGTEVTTEVVEGIAREGHGECYFAVESETIIGKCSKLFRAGLSSFVEDISIDWNVPESAARARAPFSVDLSSLHVQLPPPPMVQQIPHQIHKIYPGTRFVAFALTSQKKIPRQVTLRGQLRGGDEPIEIEIDVPVSNVRLLNNKNPDLSLIHTLAARRLITELEEECAPLPKAIDQTASPEDIRKAPIVRLGVEYQLASRHTSFVAVDDGRETSPRGRPRGQQTSRTPTRSRNDQMTGLFSGSFVGNALSFGIDAIASLLWAAFGVLNIDPRTSHGQQSRRFPGTYSHLSSSSSSSSLFPGFIQPTNDEQEEDYDSADTFSTLSSLEDSSSDWSPVRRPPASTEDEPRSPSPDIDANNMPRGDQLGTSQGQQPSAPPPPVSQGVLNLVQLQHYDGAFTLDDELGKIVGQTALQKPDDIDADNTMWATALAVAYLRKHLSLDGQGDLLDGLLDKVMESIDETMKTRFEKWVACAGQLVF